MRSAKSHSRPREPHRKTAHQRGYTSQWARYARQFRRDNPICIACEFLEPTAVADHILPVNGPHDPLFWVPENHQPLCIQCHATKTAQFDPVISPQRTAILEAWDGTRLGLIRLCGLPLATHAQE